MPASPIPQNEAERLIALHKTAIVNTKPEHVFNNLAVEAAREAAAPIALISFVDREWQWFKATVGLDIESTPRHASFCSWAIYNADVLWVEDAENDERFADNPLVHSEPYIRHYAGAPVGTPAGYLLGTICVIDRVPRPYDPMVVEKLKRISQKVASALSERERGLANMDVGAGR